MNDISRAFREDGLTSKLLNDLPCGILVITEDGIVVRLNDTIEHIFGVKNAEVTGEGLGRALCCVHSCDDNNECGSDDRCGECEVRKLALMALYSNEKKRRRVSLQVNINRHINDVTFLVCASPFKFKRDRLSILTIDNITNLKSILPPCNTEGLRGIVCQDKRMMALCKTVKQIAQTDAPVLIQGESGTGKELVAQAIHNESRRTHRRFVTINCGALPESLLESELFWHVKGAFTGALYNKRGVLS